MPDELASPSALRRQFPGVKMSAGVAAGAFIVVVALVCFLGPFLYETDQVYGDLAQSSLPPGTAGHLLGTDAFGHDMLGRLMTGGRTSMLVGLSAALFATVFGAVWGAVSGYFGGIVDTVMMRFVDALSSMPSLFILIYLSNIVTLSLPLLILLISYVAWLSPARLVRGEVLTLKVRDFVSASRLMGASPGYVVRKHLLPNALGTIVVSATFQVADSILYVAALGYLGIRMPGGSADWGSMLSSGIQYTQAGYWWMIVFPGAAIVAVVVCFYLVGDAISDALTSRGRRML